MTDTENHISTKRLNVYMRMLSPLLCTNNSISLITNL